MASRMMNKLWLLMGLTCIAALPASAQSFRVQCPESTITHPSTLHNNNSEPAYTAPTTLAPSAGGYQAPTANVNGAIKCQQISGGDGYATMGDGTQTYMFSFGPLSGLTDIAHGQPGTESPAIFNTPYYGQPLQPGDPATKDPLNQGVAFNYNGAIGLIGDPDVNYPSPGGVKATATVTLAAGLANTVGGIISSVDLTNVVTNLDGTSGSGAGYFGPVSVTFDPPNPCPNPIFCLTGSGIVLVNLHGQVQRIDVTFAGAGYPLTQNVGVYISAPLTGCIYSQAALCQTGHVDARQMLDIGVMNGNIPAPLMAIDEDDEFFLTLSNVGMIMRPDLFEQHTIHFHGYPNASAFYDGVPDASVAINIGGSFTYYYLAPDAGTYFWHCHITPPEHLQMGMVGQLYVRPRQNRVPVGNSLYTSLQAQQVDLRTACKSSADILCSNPVPATENSVTRAATGNYAYNDGDGSTYYDVEYPLQIHGFDPNFHFVGMTFNPEGFTDMKDKYFLLNGRSYPDTVGGSTVDISGNVLPSAMQTSSADGVKHFSQPLNSVINIPAGKKALLRISDLDVTEYQTLASLGIPMHVVALNAKLLRDQAGNNMYYDTNSITLAGGESLDVILDASDTTKYPAGSVFYLYTPNLDHLSNDAENFGGLMTEVRIN